MNGTFDLVLQRNQKKLKIILPYKILRRTIEIQPQFCTLDVEHGVHFSVRTTQENEVDKINIQGITLPFEKEVMAFQNFPIVFSKIFLKPSADMENNLLGRKAGILTFQFKDGMIKKIPITILSK